MSKLGKGMSSLLYVGLAVVGVLTFIFGREMFLSFYLPPSYNKYVQLVGYGQTLDLRAVRCPETYNNFNVFGCVVEVCKDFDVNLTNLSCKNVTQVVEIPRGSQGNVSISASTVRVYDSRINCVRSGYYCCIDASCRNIQKIVYKGRAYTLIRCYYKVYYANGTFIKEVPDSVYECTAKYDLNDIYADLYYEIKPDIYGLLSIYTETPGAVCGDYYVSPGEECEPPGKRESCVKDGKSGYRVCLNSSCVYSTCIVRECEPLERKCEGNNVYKCSDDGMSWVFVTTCEKGCINGVCKVCIPGEARCEGNTLVVCNSQGTGYDSTYCSYGCSNNRCLSACDNPNYKQCSPGEMETKSCSSKCGVSTRVCSNDCLWGNWSACIEKSCVPGSETTCTMPDGRPGIRKCNSNCEWDVCVSSAECVPGATQSCDKCGVRKCQSNGYWGACEGMKQCSPNEIIECTNQQGCKKQVTCTSSCSIPPCPQDECIPFTKSSCSVNGIPGERMCNSNCMWGDCIQTGVCVPGSQKSCGDCGVMTCGQDGKWGACQQLQSKCGVGYVCTLV